MRLGVAAVLVHANRSTKDLLSVAGARQGHTCTA
jgi:hypothetical protein